MKPNNLATIILAVSVAAAPMRAAMADDIIGGVIGGVIGGLIVSEGLKTKRKELSIARSVNETGRFRLR